METPERASQEPSGNQTAFLETRSGVSMFRVLSVALQKERFCAPCARKPPNGPSKNLLKASQGSYKPIPGFCVSRVRMIDLQYKRCPWYASFMASDRNPFQYSSLLNTTRARTPKGNPQTSTLKWTLAKRMLRVPEHAACCTNSLVVVSLRLPGKNFQEMT